MTTPPTMTYETYAELLDALLELEAACSGPARMPTAESANARLFVEAFWQWQQEQKQRVTAQGECHQ